MKLTWYWGTEHGVLMQDKDTARMSPVPHKAVIRSQWSSNYGTHNMGTPPHFTLRYLTPSRCPFHRMGTKCFIGHVVFITYPDDFFQACLDKNKSSDCSGVHHRRAGNGTVHGGLGYHGGLPRAEGIPGKVALPGMPSKRCIFE